jgi:AcrR family transcriptional regulator
MMVLSLASRLDDVYTAHMQQDGNSVNINQAKRSYHHGDLRSAVVAEGLRLLVSSDVESLSLREIARNVGVSATAIYRHFPDKGALLAALADAGYAQLGREQSAAAQIGGADGFAATGRAYVHFAIANPALFRLMFATTPMHVHSGQSAPEGSAAWLLHRGVAQAMPKDASAEIVFASMLRAWSLVHGLAMLILDQQIDRKVAESLIDKVISADSLNLSR